jgi:hypothetical protein
MANPEAPAPYQVFSPAVRQWLKELVGQAAAQGDKPAFLAAVQSFLTR